MPMMMVLSDSSEPPARTRLPNPPLEPTKPAVWAGERLRSPGRSFQTERTRSAGLAAHRQALCRCAEPG